MQLCVQFPRSAEQVVTIPVFDPVLAWEWLDTLRRPIDDLTRRVLAKIILASRP